MPIQSLMNDPKGFLLEMLMSLPAILIALVLHEVAHGLVAYLCGDDTAKVMGRLSLNPLKHLDPLGSLMMLLAGVGWAKPVPVNPLRFRHYRRDDLLVSLAGICMNVILCLVFSLICQIILVAAVMQDTWAAFIPEKTWQELCHYFYGCGFYVEEYLGEAMGILYEILSNVAIVNLCLAVFNLLPVPPLDGYHVLNDLVLKKDLFVRDNTARVASGILFAVVAFTDWVDKGLSFVMTHVLGGLGDLFFLIARGLGVL